MRRISLSCLMCMASAAAAFAEPAPSKDARDVLMKASDAASKLSAVAYKAEMYGEGIMANGLPHFSGKVVARRHPQTKATQVRVDATAGPPAGENAASPLMQRESLIFVNDGAQIYLQEENRKSFTTGRSSDAASLAINSMFSQKLLGDAPFTDEFRASSIAHEGTQSIEGADCDIIAVKYDAIGSRTSRLFLSQKDHLLRRVETGVSYRIANRPDAFQGKVVFSVSALDTKPAVDDKAFALACPEGYRKEMLPVGPPRVGDTSPEWEMSTPDGKKVSLKSLRGKVVVLDFWATWCGPCKMAMPAMQKLHERFKDKPVMVFGANCWERGSAMDYIKSKNYTYPQLLQADAAAGAFGVSGIPAIFTIGPDGKILYVVRGYDVNAEEAMAKIIEKTLTDSPH